MPWTDHSLLDERMIFIAACLSGEGKVSALCARYGISRKTGHNWLARYRAEGAVGLRDLSSARDPSSARRPRPMGSR